MIAKKMITLLTLTLLAISLTGCRGWRSEKPPIHPNPNLDWQASIKAQENPKDLPENTVIWGREKHFSDPSTRKDFLKNDKGSILTLYQIFFSHNLFHLV